MTLPIISEMEKRFDEKFTIIDQISLFYSATHRSFLMTSASDA